MKKLITIVSVLLICVTAICAFVACNEKDDGSETNTGLTAAKEYLHSLYRDAATETNSDFTRTAALRNEQGTYTVTWTASVISGPQTVTVVDNGDGTVTINVQEVNESVAVDTLYTLTATIADEAGNTETLTYNYKISKFKVATFAEYLAAEKGTILVMDGIVTGILPKGNGATNDGYYVNTLDGGGIYVYGTSGADLQVGQTVRISGEKDLYSGTHELKNATHTVINSEITAVTPVDYTALYTNAADLKDKDLNEKQALLVTIKGVTIDGVSPTDNSYYLFSLAGKQSYIRISSSSCPMTTEKQTAFKNSYNAHIGYTADVTGVICIYSGNFYLTPVSENAVSNFVAPQKSDAELVADVKDSLTIGVETIFVNQEIELPTAGTGIYADVAISWELATNACATLEVNVLSVVLPEEATELTLTATISKGEATETKEFTIAVDAAPVENPSSVSLTAPKLGLGAYAAGDAVVSGYDFSFTELGDFGNGIQCRINKDDAQKKSTLFNTEAFWTGIYQIDITLNADKAVYDNTNAFSFTFGTAANALNSEVKFSTIANQREYTITPDAQTYTYFKMEILLSYSFYFDEIKIWFVDPATAPKTDDDKIAEEKDALSLAVKEYTENGTATLPVVGATYPEVTIAWSSEATELAIDGANLTVTAPADNKIVTITATITCGTGTAVTKEFEILFNVKVETTIEGALAAPVGVSATLSGTVEDAKSSEFYINDGTNRILVYKPATKAYNGDVVTVSGKISAYKGVNQINTGATVTITTAHTCSYGQATCTEAATCTSCGATTGEALGHIDVEAPTDICDRCEADLSGNTTTVSNTIEAIATANSWTNSTQYTSFLLDTNITVTVTEEGSNNNTGKYYTNGQNWRIYQNESPALTISAAAGYEIVSVEVEYTVSNTGILTLNGNNVASGATTTVDGQSITFGVGNTGSATNGQVRVSAITVIYEAVQA